MTDDLVKRLREISPGTCQQHTLYVVDRVKEAADHIEELEAENERLRKMLMAVANQGGMHHTQHPMEECPFCAIDRWSDEQTSAKRDTVFDKAQRIHERDQRETAKRRALRSPNREGQNDD